ESATLFKNTTIDENGTKYVEYKNKLGQVIAKMVISLDIPGSALVTYYVYDDFSNLRYVISPNAADYMKNHANGTIGHITTNTTIQQFCYYYQYDARKRMIIKKLPGAEPVYLVYNKRDQLVLSQDGNLRNNNDWLFTKYDVFNRQIITGKYHHSEHLYQAEMQELVNENENYFENTDPGDENGYTSDAFPTSNYEVYTVTFYDNYDYIEQTQFNNRYAFVNDEIDFLYPLAGNTKGQVTAVKTKILPNSEIELESELEYLISVNYYDKYYRVIQTIFDNHLGEPDNIGLDIVSNQINFTGDILLTKENHDNGTDNIIVETKYEYDNGKRLTKTRHRINNAADWTTLNHQQYDELGRVKRKHLHGSSGNSQQTVNYQYNIRDWFTDINDVASLGDDLFAMHLGYTSNTYQHPQFNGNIAGMQWKTSMFDECTYNFDYDGANRLITANYTGEGSHNTTYEYDFNGNIEFLDREGQLGSSSDYDMIDELTYTYTGTGNQLKTVNDINDGINGNHQNNGFSDNGSYQSEEYFYDDNGNMISDLNKDMTITKYNFLNLPEQFNISTTNYNEISYLYSAGGKKLRKQTYIDYTPANTTDYIGSFVYEDNGIFELRYIITPEGRVMANTDGTFDYQYFLKDHLGNTRVTFTQTGEVIQEDSYYPFGMAMTGLSHQNGSDYKNKYLYNGKELQDEFGLDWYDYGARMYDPQLGRWHVVDPLAEEFPSWTPYHYVHNNPINLIDPTGMNADWVESADGKIYWDKNAISQATTKEGETYLGKNVLVGTHNRDASGNEAINSARFDLYLESNKTGSSATIYGNTVPGDITKFGTLAEGLFPMRFQGRASKLAKGINDLSFIINEGKGLPTVNGNPNKANSDMLTAVFFHAGNYGKERLTYIKKGGSTGYISKGCQTSGCGQGSRKSHNIFMQKAGKDFNGFYYLRSKPKSFYFTPTYIMPADNTYVAPILHTKFLNIR
ncbi:MAG: RHS repeat-associated core domain-containing protein, partial [Bacteroidales bacterium]|nr:RHS repeat-associated core domain-containing protein [Bacteroidales bacterium]